MTSKDIIIRLIDEKLISGEEAYTLMNDVLHDEMRQVYENLKRLDTPYPDMSQYTVKWNGNTYITDTATSLNTK